jgi:hypothetical protein
MVTTGSTWCPEQTPCGVDILIMLMVFMLIYNLSRSFSGSTMHGSMLPSTLLLRPEDITLSNLTSNNQDSGHIALRDRDGGGGGGGPPRVSNGDHITKNKRNNIAAKRYQRVRACRSQIHNYWGQ